MKALADVFSATARQRICKTSKGRFLLHTLTFRRAQAKSKYISLRYKVTTQSSGPAALPAGRFSDQRGKTQACQHQKHTQKSRAYLTKTSLGRRLKRSRCCKVHQQPKPQQKIPIHCTRIPRHKHSFTSCRFRKFSRFAAQMAHALVGCAALQNVADADWLMEKWWETRCISVSQAVVMH